MLRILSLGSLFAHSKALPWCQGKDREAYNGLESLVAGALEARLAKLWCVGQRIEPDSNFSAPMGIGFTFGLFQLSSGLQRFGASEGDAEDEVEVISAVLMGLTPAGEQQIGSCSVKSENVPRTDCWRNGKARWDAGSVAPLCGVDPSAGILHNIPTYRRAAHSFLSVDHHGSAFALSILSEGQNLPLRCGPVLRDLLYLRTFAGLWMPSTA
ncbi:hypothetical protein KC365_g140 [Hortaea werneckii]|nr:hypothetical protein KC365_g140 [Hortaea werneckii]